MMSQVDSSKTKEKQLKLTVVQRLRGPGKQVTNGVIGRPTPNQGTYGPIKILLTQSPEPSSRLQASFSSKCFPNRKDSLTQYHRDSTDVLNDCLNPKA